jgi:hypothetical protein
MNETRKHPHSSNETRTSGRFQTMERSGSVTENAMAFVREFGGTNAAKYLARGLTLAEARAEFAKVRRK